MPEGFQSYNTQGNIQFDAVSSAFACIGSGTMVAADVWFVPGEGFVHGYDPTQGIPDTYYDGTYPLESYYLPANTRYVAYAAAGSFWYSPVWEGNNKRLTMITQPTAYTGAGGQRTDLSEHVVTYYAFGAIKNIPPAASGAGLQLFDGSGALVWDSSMFPVLVTGAVNYTSTTYPTVLTIPGSPAAVMPLLNSTLVPSRKGNRQHWVGIRDNTIGEYPYMNQSGPNTNFQAYVADGLKFLGISAVSLPA